MVEGFIHTPARQRKLIGKGLKKRPRRSQYVPHHSNQDPCRGGLSLFFCTHVLWHSSHGAITNHWLPSVGPIGTPMRLFKILGNFLVFKHIYGQSQRRSFHSLSPVYHVILLIMTSLIQSL